MNEFEAFAKHTRAGFNAYLRTPRDGMAKPIVGKGGKPILYETREQALEAANQHLVNYVNGNLYRCGDVYGAAEEEAEALFNLPVVRSKRRVVVTSARKVRQR